MFRLIMLFSFLSLMALSFNLVASAKDCKGKDKIYFKPLSHFEVAVKSYEPTGGSTHLVLIIPPTGGINFIDESYAEFFCKKGMEAIVVMTWSGDKKLSFDLDVHRRFYQNGQTAIDAVLDNHKDQRVGILGTSVGGIHSAISWARNERIEAAFLIVGGAGIAKIIANSDQKVLVDAKKIRFKELGYKNNDEYIQDLAEVIPFEPLLMPLKREGRRLGMVVSTDDMTVPSENQEMLRQLWKPDVVSYSSLGHVPTVLRTWATKKKMIARFFLNSFSDSRASVEN